MDGPLVAACLWVIAAALTALLPMRGQMVPGGLLLLTAPVLAVWVGAAHGWLWTLAAAGVALSVFRRPLGHLVRRARGGAG